MGNYSTIKFKLIMGDDFMPVQIDEEGKVVITNKVDAEQYIKRKLLGIDSKQKQIAELQTRLDAEVTELKNLTNNE
jgi:hypothetical protein